MYLIYYWSISFIVTFFSFFIHKMPHCVNCAKGQTKLNEGRYCKTCFAQIKNTSGNQELIIENELINRSSISDHSIWPSPTQSRVHKSEMEISEKEKEKGNISQDALEFESTNDDHENKLDNSGTINNLEIFIDINKSKELKDSCSKSFHEKDLNMHVLYERLYQDQKTQIEAIQELHN